MSHKSLYAYKKNTEICVFPQFAERKNSDGSKIDYTCPSCSKDVILRKGHVSIAHFAHKTSENPCSYYNHPSQSELHKNAKEFIYTLIQKKIQFSITKKCVKCNENINFKIPVMNEISKVEKEHSFKYNNNNYKADIAYYNDNTMYIFEIFNTHRTNEENIPESWFEIDVKAIINVLNNELNEIIIPCCRDYKCNNCKGLEELNTISKASIETIIPIKVKQPCKSRCCIL